MGINQPSEAAGLAAGREAYESRRGSRGSTVIPPAPRDATAEQHVNPNATVADGRATFKSRHPRTTKEISNV